MATCADCLGQLAADNRSTRCTPCARTHAARLSRPHPAPIATWSSTAVAKATAGRDFGLLLKAYRNSFRPPITQAALADWLELSQAQVSRIESGRTAVTDLTKLTRWATTLQLPASILWFAVPRSEPETVDPVVSPPAVAPLPTATLTLTPTGIPAGVVGPDTVAVVQETTQAFRQIDNRYGGGHVRSAVSIYLSTEVETALRADRFSRGTRKQYHGAAIELQQLAGWMAYDVGDAGAGRQHLQQALSLAADTGSDALSAEILAAISHQAAFNRQPAEAVDFAVAARRAAHHSGIPALIAESAVLEAQGLALQTNRRGCIAALQRAERAFAAATAANTPPWLIYFDSAYLSAKFARVLFDLRQTSHAERFARQSLKMLDGYERGRLFNTALLASILVADGQLDEAIVHTRTALAMTASVRSSRARGYLRDVATQLTAYHANSAVRQLQQELTAAGIVATDYA